MFCSATFCHFLGNLLTPFIYSLALLPLCCCTESSLAGEQVLLSSWPLRSGAPIAECRLQQLQRQDSGVEAPGLWSTGLRAGSCGLSCSAACGIFPDQGSNPYLLLWQADSLWLCHQGSCFLSFWAKRTVTSAFYSIPGKWNFFPLKEFCKDQNKWKLEGARSGEHSGWTRTSKLSLCLVIKETHGLTLSWRRSTCSLLTNPGHCRSSAAFSWSNREKAMATHSSVPAWRIPGVGEPGGLPSMGLDTTEAT